VLGYYFIEFLPKCMTMMDFYTKYATIVQTWVLGVCFVSKLCSYNWYNVFNCFGMN